ncbi:Lipoprotein [Sulfitobacter noctilucae]|uniref:DUF3833 family protein n=1 Tax=Sulfitobacter noctilucae TaxID=1342302 RepID=UPI000467FC14|nr:DUF3833 family protein [Sulfitobacter noctilucae]KIN75211.1 Lipoprotein [Sulfitobacter noctilucae]
MESLLLILIGTGLASLMIWIRKRMAGFYGQSPADYEDGWPVFDIQQHLNGDMVCEGVIFGPLGRVTSTFIADFHITWEGNKAVMDEVFRYNDGSRQTRQWIITLGSGSDGSFITEADDVPGNGRGMQSGGTVQMCYDIRLPDTSGGHLLNTIDWMYLTPDGAIMNRSQFRKYGFKVAELVATIRPKETT